MLLKLSCDGVSELNWRVPTLCNHSCPKTWISTISITITGNYIYNCIINYKYNYAFNLQATDVNCISDHIQVDRDTHKETFCIASITHHTSLLKSHLMNHRRRQGKEFCPDGTTFEGAELYWCWLALFFHVQSTHHYSMIYIYMNILYHTINTIRHYTILYYIILYYTILYHIILYYTILYYIILH